MARPARKTEPKEEQPEDAARPSKPDAATLWLSGLAIAFGRIMDRFGAPTAVASILILMLWLFADETTRNDFMRAMLFGEHGWPIPLLGIVVCLDILFGYKLRRRFLDGESAELKRIAQEKRRLQEKLLGRTLPRTKHASGLDAEPSEDE